jgi:bifunctional UDP-N-acetylglucosamine pyrophosphorylase/glucosamine-1-phosphate N-acetyltransferase
MAKHRSGQARRTTPPRSTRNGSTPGLAPASLWAIVLAAGKGTRMRSEIPKVLHRALGRPLVHYPIEAALGLGVDGVVVVVGHGADAVRRAVEDRFGPVVRTAVQAEQRGTGHAVQQALPALRSAVGRQNLDGVRVVILYGDVPLVRPRTLAALADAYAEAGGPLALVTFAPDDPHGYGRVVRKGKGAGRIKRIVEEKDATAKQRALRECNAGIYLCDGPFLESALATLSSDNAQGELYLTDLVERAAEAGTVGATATEPDEVLGVNDRVDLARVERLLGERRLGELMRAGVTLRDPRSIVVEPEVVVDPDVEIAAGCQLRGQTRIGKGTRLDVGTVITDSIVGENVTVKPYSVVSESRVGDGAIIGPFAHLRPGTVLGPRVHIGNFVETKKALLGEGSKANHLSYLGDAQIGAGVNVGAGTITCNYDGVHKHTTVIEDGVFIGSDTQLVAPVRVGREAYVGAGTTVTKDVPPGALALTRAPQKVIEGYVDRKRGRRRDDGSTPSSAAGPAGGEGRRSSG